MLKVFTPPQKISYDRRAVFLAGSIEMDKATKWQDKVIEMLKEEDLDILNPRRADWDSSWEQTVNCPEFVEQVTWELDGLDRSTHVFFYLEPGTMSPISLMELGMMRDEIFVVVVCPEGFHRKGNIDIFCKRYDIPCYNTLEEGITCLKSIL